MTVNDQSARKFQLHAQVLNAGTTESRLIVLSTGLSFWGGFDPKTGRIIDQHHPEAGICVSGCALALPASRGSAGTPAGVAESLRVGVGPSAIIVQGVDVNIMIGAAVAARLYDINVPVVALGPEDYARLENNQHISIRADGMLTVTYPPATESTH